MDEEDPNASMEDVDPNRKWGSEQIDPLVAGAVNPGGAIPGTDLVTGNKLGVLAHPPRIVPPSPPAKKDPKRAKTFTAENNNGKK